MDLPGSFDFRRPSTTSNLPCGMREPSTRFSASSIVDSASTALPEGDLLQGKS